jgi:hypothetical protein
MEEIDEMNKMEEMNKMAEIKKMGKMDVFISIQGNRCNDFLDLNFGQVDENKFRAIIEFLNTKNVRPPIRNIVISGTKLTLDMLGDLALPTGITFS